LNTQSTGTATIGLPKATAIKTPKMPKPTQTTGLGTSSHKPAAMPAAPAKPKTKAKTSRQRRDDSGIATSSRMAATGGTLAARLAGIHAANIVTSTPTK
jgi:hypothetical protein